MLSLGVILLLIVWLLWGLHRNQHLSLPSPQRLAGSNDVDDRDIERVISELRARF